MSEEFKKLFEKASEIRNEAEDELWFLLSKTVGKTYKFINTNENLTFYITVEYFRGFDKIGVTHINEKYSESVSDVWDVEEFYEIIKDSVEIE